MKTDQEVKAALEYHVTLAKFSKRKQLETIAIQLGWTVDYLKGYREGVKWAYEWFLGIDKEH